MALSNGPNLGLLVHGLAGEEHYDEILAQFRGLDGLVQCAVIDRDLATPPASPADGDAYIVATGGTGAWSGHAGKIARYSSVLTAWEIYTPRSGWRAVVVDEAVTLTYLSSAWTQVEASILVGINNQSGTTYTLAAIDRTRVTRLTNAAAVTVTVPLNATVAIPIGSVIAARQVGAGEVTFTPTGGVTVNVPAGYQAKTARVGATVALHKVATDEWDLTGDLKV